MWFFGSPRGAFVFLKFLIEGIQEFGEFLDAFGVLCGEVVFFRDV